jgi:hypothetical protein
MAKIFIECLPHQIKQGFEKIMKLASVLLTIAVAVFLGACPLPFGWEPPSTPGIAVNPRYGLSTTEGGGTDAFTVVLDSQPAASVTLALSSSNLNEGTVDPSLLVFSSGNWDIPQTVTVTGVNDALVDGDQTYTIITYPANSDDYDYHDIDAYDVLVTNIDDDRQPDVIDQQQPVIDTSTAGAVGIGGASEQILAQVITAGISGPLMAVKMPIGGSSGDLVIEIQGVIGDEPNGTVVAADVFNNANFPTEESDGFKRFVFSEPVDFMAGNKFAVVLSSPGGSYNISKGSAGNPYPGGDGFYDARPNPAGVWVRLGGLRDLPFKTIISADVTHGVIEFSAYSYTVDEGEGISTITVNRTIGNTGAVSVDYTTAGGTTDAGDDYSAAPGTLVWNDGDSTPKTFSIAVIDDTLVEPDESVVLNLSSVSGGAILRIPSISTLTIIDNDVSEVVDQQQPVIDKSVGGTAIGGASEQKLAQVVTAGISGPLMAVKMPIGGSSGDLVIEIQEVTGDEPNGTVLASETFNSTNYPAEDSDGMRRFAFSAPVDITDGHTFAIVLSSPGGSYGIFRGPTGNPYPGGDGFYDARPNTPGRWVPLSTRRDLPFKTIVHTQ